MKPFEGPRGPLRLALLSMLLLLPVSYRHWLVWGGEQAWLLHLFEYGGTLLFTLGGCLALRHGLREIEAGRLNARSVWRGGLLLLLLALCCLPYTSEDVVSYVGRGRLMALHEGNPWVDLASQRMPEDPVLPMMKGWVDFPLPCGPLLAWGLAGIAWVGEQLPLPDGGRIWASITLYRLLTCLCVAACARILLSCVRPHEGRQRAKVLLLFLWNPFVLLEFGVAGHNDVWMLLPLLAGYATLGKSGSGGSGLVLSAMAKPTSLATGPLWLAESLRRRSLGRFAFAALSGSALLAGTWWLYWSGPEGSDWIRKQSGIEGVGLQGLLNDLFGGPAGIYRAVGLGTCLLLGLGLMLRVLRGRTALASALVTMMLGTHLLGLPLAFAWYQVVWLPFALLAGRPRVAMWLAAVTGPSYVVWLTTREFTDMHSLIQWLLCVLGPVLAWVSERDHASPLEKG